MQKVIPFYTLKGNARAAMNYYLEVFPGSKIENLSLFEEGERGIEGQVKNGTFTVLGMTMMFMDMDPNQCPDLNFASSLFVTCDTEEMFDYTFEKLSHDGIVLMGPEAIMGLKKVAWVTDAFGITWQLVLN